MPKISQLPSVLTLDPAGVFPVVVNGVTKRATVQVLVDAVELAMGLGTAAYCASAAFDTAGAASAVQTDLSTHTALTTTAHGGIVASSDSRLTDARTPTDGSVTNAKVAVGAAIVESKLALSYATHSSSNDPASGEKSALAGTSGTPGIANKYVTDGDSRNTNSRQCNNSFDSASTARTNLGLGTAALSATGDFDASGAASAVNSSLTTHAALTTTAHGGLVASSDSRLTNARTPTSHAASHQNGGADEIATATAAANAIPKAGAGGTLAIGWLPTGSTSSTACIGNDSRLSDSRTPTSHASSHAAAGSDPLALSESQVTNLTTDLAAKESTANKGQANGYASLNSSGAIPAAQRPSCINTQPTSLTQNQTISEQGVVFGTLTIPSGITLTLAAGGILNIGNLFLAS